MLKLCLGKNDKSDKEKILDDEIGNWKDPSPIVFVHEAQILESGPQVSFSINGELFEVTPSRDVTAETSLNTFIRECAKLPGTKFMCLEGGCGSCVVSVRGTHPSTKEIRNWSVNSCLFPVLACHGLEITTIEGLGGKKKGYHDLQKRLAAFHGSQCGYCSPGAIMQINSWIESNGEITKAEVEHVLGGNLCRCTGYRPILDAFKSMAVDECSDIEDLERGIKKICSKTGKSCAGSCSAKVSRKIPVKFVDPLNKQWIIAYTLQQVLDALRTAVGSYMLIHGNTAHGAYRRDPDLQTFIDVTCVEELHSISTGSNLVFGGNVTIADAMAALLVVADSDSTNFGYCRAVWEHLNLVANTSVRNTGSLAGNLMLKYYHREFPSDIFLLLETLGASVEITDASGAKTTVKPSAFLNLGMQKKVITKITLYPLPASRFTFRSYKIMPRALNTHAYVNAGFLIEKDSRGAIKWATVVFGGLGCNFIHASLTEAYLTNKNLCSNDALMGARTMLDSEIRPTQILPESSPEYRKQLAIALFYKFVLSITGSNQIRPEFQSGALLLERALSSGMQEFDSDPKKWPLNQNVTKLEAMLQTAGEAEFIVDMPSLPNTLHAAFVQATEVGATITGIDATEALAFPGVVRFFAASDVPGSNNFMPAGMSDVYEDEEIFCSGLVRFNGEPCGLIVACSRDVAERAAKLVKVQYSYKKSSKVLLKTKDVLESSEARDRVFTGTKKLVPPPRKVAAGQKITGRFEIGMQYHFAFETQACYVIPSDEGFDVYSSSQWMDILNTALSICLGMQKNRFNVRVKRVGGGYGCKMSRNLQTTCAAAIAAYHLNRPVRMVLTIEAHMETIGKRYGCITDYEVDVDGNGKIHKCMNNFSQDYGWCLNESVIEASGPDTTNCYIPEVFAWEGKKVLTDAPSNTWCRAPCTTEGIAMTENIMEHIAQVLQKDPVEVRLQNIPADSPLQQIVKDFIKSVDYYQRKEEIAKFNAANRWRKRGIALVPIRWPFVYVGYFHANVSIYQFDGTVVVTHGGIEMGQGINTKAAQVAAHILGIPLNMVTVKASNNLTAPNDFETGSSVTSESVAYAVIQSCNTLLERLKPFQEPGKVWTEVVQAAYGKYVDLNASYMYKAGDVEAYPIWGVSCAEAEVDILTGQYNITRVDIHEDVGESMSPGIDIGQCEGAFVFGMGYWLSEQIIYDKSDGKLLTNRTWNYLVPSTKDIPVDFRITFLKNRPNPVGVLRSKAIGEPPLCMSIVVYFAIRNAIRSARLDAGLPDTFFDFTLPATPENVVLATQTNINDFYLK